jgi:transposase InsO family protein
MRWLLAGWRGWFVSRFQLIAEIACLAPAAGGLQAARPSSAAAGSGPAVLDSDVPVVWQLAGLSGARHARDGARVASSRVAHYWRWQSKHRQPGRKRIPLALRQLIRRMAAENPLWGQVRIMAELLKLGYVISPRTVRKYMRRPWSGKPSPRWKNFLEQHAKDIWACDFIAVRTLTFQTLYAFFLIHHATREIVHIRVTRHPTALWTGQQLVNACFEREPPRYLIHDRDGIFGSEFSRRVRSLGMREIRTPVRAPKANSIAERFVGTLRRECLDHVFIFNERHLQKVLDEFVDYYNRQRPHRSLGHRPPCPATAMLSASSPGPPVGQVIAAPVLGGPASRVSTGGVTTLDLVSGYRSCRRAGGVVLSEAEFLPPLSIRSCLSDGFLVASGVVSAAGRAILLI